MTSSDGCIRNFLQYHGAHTGRWAGRGFQPHNLPRTKTNIAEINNAIEKIDNVTGQEFIKLAQTILPALVIPDSGYTFLMGDFSAIEARGIALLSGQLDLVELFQRDEKVYEIMAAAIFRKPVSKIDKDSFERYLGKKVVLGCGYGMGEGRFYETCLDEGLDISEQLASRSVGIFRERYSKIVKFWYDLTNAFSYLCIHRGVRKVGRLILRRESKYISIQLPSGRLMYYHRPQKTGRDIMYYNHMQKRDVPIWGGILAENVTQAMCRDILVECMLQAEKKKLNPVLHVHDEIVCMVKKEDVKEKEIIFKDIMNTAPAWCRDFPLATEIEICERYHK